MSNTSFQSQFYESRGSLDRGVLVLLLVLVFSNEMNVKIMVWILLSHTLNTIYHLLSIVVKRESPCLTILLFKEND